MTRSKGWSEYLVAMLTLTALVAISRVARVDQWLLASLGALLGIWGIRFGARLRRSSGLRTDMLSGALFSGGGWGFAVLHARSWPDAMAIAIAVCSLLMMILATIVFRAGRRRNALDPAVPH